MGKIYFSKRLLGVEDIDLDTTGEGLTNDFTGVDGSTKPLHKVNASHIPLTQGTRKGYADVDAAIHAIQGQVDGIESVESLDGNKDVPVAWESAQSVIDAQPRLLNGYTLTFQFPHDGSVQLASSLDFVGFMGGDVVVDLGGSMVSPAGAFDQLVLFKDDAAITLQNGTLDHSMLNSTPRAVTLLSVGHATFKDLTFIGNTASVPPTVAIDTNGSPYTHDGITSNEDIVDPSKIVPPEVDEKIDEITGDVADIREDVENLDERVSALEGSGEAMAKNYLTAFGKPGNMLGIGIDNSGAVGFTSVGFPENCLTIDYGHKCAVGIFNGLLYIAGEGNDGFNGSRTATSEPGWKQLSPLSGWTDVSCGYRFGVGLRNGKLYTWGLNNKGQLGTGDKLPRYGMFRVLEWMSSGHFIPRTLKWEKVVAGYQWLFALTEPYDFDGTGAAYRRLYVCGNNASGQLGVGSTSDKGVVYLTSTKDRVRDFSTGGYFNSDGNWFHSMLIDDNGVLWVTGKKANGQLGLGPGATGQETTWKKVDTRGTSSDGKVTGTTWTPEFNPSDWVKCSVGGRFSAALTESGDVYVAGYKDVTIGVSTASDGAYYFVKIHLPSTLETNEKVIDIAAGNHGLLMLTNKGRVLRWGNNVNYSLGKDGKGYIPTSWTGDAEIIEIGTPPAPISDSIRIMAGTTVDAGGIVTTSILFNGNVPPYTSVVVSEHTTSGIDGTYVQTDPEASGRDRIFTKTGTTNTIKYSTDTDPLRWELYSGETLVGHATVDGAGPADGLSWVDEAEVPASFDVVPGEEA